jgi:hypothetical protein
VILQVPERIKEDRVVKKSVGLGFISLTLVGAVGCASSSDGSTGDDQNVTATVPGPSKTAEALLSEAFTARKNQALVLRASLYFPAKLDVGKLGAKVAEITEQEDGGYTITFATRAKCTSLDCIVIQLSATSFGAGDPSTDTLAGGVPASFDEGCGAHGCDKAISFRKPGMPSGFPKELGGENKDFNYSLRITTAPLDKAALIAMANDGLAAGPRSINDVVIGDAMAKTPSFSTKLPLLYPPGFGLSGHFVGLSTEGDTYTIAFTTKAGCKAFDCTDMEMSAMKADGLIVSANDKLLSGTPAETDEGCGAHGCDQSVRWLSKDGIIYSVRHLVHDQSVQQLSMSALLAMASAAEERGPRNP